MGGLAIVVFFVGLLVVLQAGYWVANGGLARRRSARADHP